MASMRPSWERLRTILKRQGKSVFGPDYQPAIRATPREAPSISRPSVLQSTRLGRDVHALSIPERSGALLALYHPKLFELHEQKMLSVGPRPNPLFGHPAAIGLNLPQVRGTVVVAEQLGHLRFHPKVKAPRSPGSKDWMWVPFPYIADLLLFMADDGGPYCINWTIKAEPQDFDRPPPRGAPTRDPHAAVLRTQARQEIERVYYEEAGIRTVRVAKTDINEHVAANLRHLFGWQQQVVPLQPEQRAEMLLKYEVAIDLGVAPSDMIGQLMLRYRCRREDCLAVLYQAIWSRRMRVDLFKPVLPDKPLQPERHDVLTEYGAWFERRPCISASN